MINYDSNNIMTWTRLGMRKSFGVMMANIAQMNENLIVLAADVASSANLKEFADLYPNQFYNVGIAEQNMIGIAAGLAKEGHNVFVVSFAPFVSMRAYEAIRTLVGYMELNVKVVALSSGLSLGSQGNTHYCVEDLSLMRTIPEIMILSPADCVEEAKCIEYLATYDGPAYLRLTGLDGMPGIHKEDYVFDSRKILNVRNGENIAIIATGSIVNECIRAARALKKDNISGAVFHAHSIKPFDVETIKHICRNYNYIISVEEHNIIGGLGSVIADVLAGMEKHPPLIKIGIDDKFTEAGDYAFILKENKLDAAGIRDVIIDSISGR